MWLIVFFLGLGYLDEDQRMQQRTEDRISGAELLVYVLLAAFFGWRIWLLVAGVQP